MHEGRSLRTTIIAGGVIVAMVALFAFGLIAGTGGASNPASDQVAAGAAHQHGTTTSTEPVDITDQVAVAQAHLHDLITATTAGSSEVAAAGGAHDHGSTATATSIVVPVASAGSGGAPVQSVTTVTAAPQIITTPTTAPSSTPTTVKPTTSTTVAVPTGDIISVDDPRLTPAQRAAAISLIDRTRAGMAGFTSEAAVTAAGYTSIGDSSTGFEHFVNWTYLSDGRDMDPNHIESVVMKVAGGVKTVASAMYILSVGETLADAPDIAGPLTRFHDHQNLCWVGNRVVGLTGPDGTCAQGVFLPTPPMLHVWLTPQQCGPFAGIEGHGTAGCNTGH